MPERTRETSTGALLFVDDDPEMRDLVDETLRGAGYPKVHTAASVQEALQELGRHSFDLVITDLRMPRGDGDVLIGEVRALDPHLPVVVMSGYASVQNAVTSMKAGACHFVAKPFQVEELLGVIAEALRKRRVRQELQASAGAKSGSRSSAHIVAESPAMRRTMELVRRAAAVDTPVLLLGETGTGKELLARALHDEGRRARKAFMAINCSAIPEGLLESQLFGHRRGSFTDAREDRAGLFQEARGGTVFLDEIGDMPLALQSKLLRVLQEGEVHPIGASLPVKVDVRVIAATHRDLESLVEEGRFRTDLYYRLNVIAVRVPPLRERMQDLVPLVVHFLDKLGSPLGKARRTLTPEAMDRLRAHHWPGNVRELKNAIEGALVLGTGEAIDVHDLPDMIRKPQRPPAPVVWTARPLADVERDEILSAFKQAKGNKSRTARLLGINRKTLYRKLEEYGVP